MTARIFRNIGGAVRRPLHAAGPTPALDAADHREPEPIYDYDRLMRVTITNTFYNVGNSLSPDFTTQPTAKTATMLRSLDMLVRDEGAGFSVLYNRQRRRELIEYLRRHYPDPAEKGDVRTGTWLSFTLTLRNASFYYFTDIPFDIDVTRQSYYVNNMLAHEVGKRIVLGETPYLPQSSPFETVEGQRDEPFPDGATEIEILDVLGAVVQCYPRVVPRALLDEENVPFITCDVVNHYIEKHGNKNPVRRDMCTINFFLLRAGYYTIRFVGAAVPDRPVIYRGNSNEALCFIDLFLADPQTDGAGIFPINNLFDSKPTISQVDYWIDFRARSSFWDYYIVPPSKGSTLHDLQIVSTKNGEQIPFSPAERVYIGLGTDAYLTKSEVPLLIQISSEYAFRLTGSIEDSQGMITTSSTLMPRLPVASPSGTSPIGARAASGRGTSSELPAIGPTYGRSAIYVYL